MGGTLTNVQTLAPNDVTSAGWQLLSYFSISFVQLEEGNDLSFFLNRPTVTNLTSKRKVSLHWGLCCWSPDQFYSIMKAKYILAV